MGDALLPALFGAMAGLGILLVYRGLKRLRDRNLGEERWTGGLTVTSGLLLIALSMLLMAQS
jgi:hypothetical protein